MSHSAITLRSYASPDYYNFPDHHHHFLYTRHRQTHSLVILPSQSSPANIYRSIHLTTSPRLLLTTTSSADVPDPPNLVKLVSCANRVAQLHWSHAEDNFSPVLQFIVEYNTSFSPHRFLRPGFSWRIVVRTFS